jgi:multicomponent Na+:H+ antiporter subunit F
MNMMTMILFAAGPSVIAAQAGMVVLSVGLAVCFARLWIGPSLPDRLVALDMIATLLVGLFALLAIIDIQPAAMRVATLLALINFLGTVAFAVYIDRQVNR